MNINELDRMTQARWDSFSEADRIRLRDLGGLHPQLKGLEGWRVEVTEHDGEVRRFIVGRSTGWRPCSLEIKTRRSFGGHGAPGFGHTYANVRKLYKVR